MLTLHKQLVENALHTSQFHQGFMEPPVVHLDYVENHWCRTKREV